MLVAGEDSEAEDVEKGVSAMPTEGEGKQDGWMLRYRGDVDVGKTEVQ
jgi:hypothetical protein